MPATDMAATPLGLWILGGTNPGEKRTTGTMVRFANGLVPRNPGLQDAIPLGLESPVRSRTRRRFSQATCRPRRARSAAFTPLHRANYVRFGIFSRPLESRTVKRRKRA